MKNVSDYAPSSSHPSPKLKRMLREHERSVKLGYTSFTKGEIMDFIEEIWKAMNDLVDGVENDEMKETRKKWEAWVKSIVGNLL